MRANVPRNGARARIWLSIMSGQLHRIPGMVAAALDTTPPHRRRRSQTCQSPKPVVIFLVGGGSRTIAGRPLAWPSSASSQTQKPITDDVARSDMFRGEISFRSKEDFLHSIEPNIDPAGAGPARHECHGRGDASRKVPFHDDSRSMGSTRGR
jgi:hypothetical protein